MSINHYIYLLFDNINPSRYLSYEVHKLGRKIGSTCNMKTRMKPYLTGHPDKVPLECYYKILNPELYTCYAIDNMIKIKFDEYNLKGSGGIEFYEIDKVTQKVLEEYFDEMGIKWEKLTEVIDENIHKITKEDIQNLAYDIEHSNTYLNEITPFVPEKKYDLLNKYLNQIINRNIIKELLQIDENLFDYLLDNYDDSLIIKLKEQNIDIIDDQIETILITKLYFNKYDKGIWNLFCRYGKTMLSSLLCSTERDYKKILIIVPSLYLVTQTYKTWVKYWPYKIIKKICCEENISNEVEINKFYNENENCIFISTYHSSEKFKDYKFDICIYDEAHRTAGSKYDTTQSSTISNCESDEDVPKIKVFKLLLESKNIKQKLFLTATKKVYNGDEDNIYCMDDENIYGKTIVSVSAIKAKELGRICPYKIMTIKTTPNEITFDLEKFFEENKLKEHQIKRLTELKERYIMFAKGLIDCMRKNEIKHVITFHEYIINCKFFSRILNNINKTENLLKNVEYITGNDNKTTRLEIINDFETTDYSILCSAKVLQEGVDIPRCDGVIFIDNKTSNIDITQSLSRCLTSLKDKKAYIMIPYVDGDDLKNDEKTNDLRLLLRNIKEIDENIQEYFKKYNEIDFDNKTKEEKEEELRLLNIKYNINVELNFIDEMKEISYIPYKQAKELIKEKYNDLNDYKNNIEEFSKELPIDADKIYKRFGWKNWNDYLGLESKMNLFRISKLIQNENERRKKLLNGRLTVPQSIKYILKISLKKMFPKDISNQILDYDICRSLNGLTPEATVSALCGELYKKQIINRTKEKPYKYSYDGYNEFEIIDSKQKYIEYCKNINTELDQNIEPENGNWIKFCLKEYDELVESHYKSDELKDVFKTLEISNKDQYIERSKINKKLINYTYISNGFYNESNLGINLDKLYFIEKQNIRRF
uniref:Helicase ATP-binding domain-containing protein n=1 Tax=viral metagenome TaxID=1070528 RepID=A0A6C0H112_9ZZZZ